MSVNHSQFTSCAADGFGVVSNVVDGTGPVKQLSFDVKNSRISANRLSNLRVENATAVQQLAGRIENTDLSQSAGTPVILENPYDVHNEHTNLDLGGGSLGSTGHNCIYGGAATDVTTLNYNLDAKQNWWGNPNGPGLGRTLAIGGTIRDTPVLTTSACGPTSPPGPTGRPGATSPSSPIGPRSRFSCAKPSARLAGATLGPVTLGMTRARARSRFARFSLRGRRDMDFFCPTRHGIRVGYASPVLLHGLSPRERRRVRGRAVLLLSSNPYYALRGVHPGARLATVARWRGVGKGFQVGLNRWYLTPEGSSRGVLKVRHGRIEEIGIANAQLTRTRHASMSFLMSFS